MRRLILVIILSVVVSCKSTKRLENTSRNLKVENVITEKSNITTIKQKDDLTEVITETITERSEVIRDGSVVPIITTVRTIERFNSSVLEGVKVAGLRIDRNSLDVNDTSSFERVTEGQEMIGDITSGIVEGVGKTLFGNMFQYITFGVIVFIVLFILLFKRKKDVPSK